MQALKVALIKHQVCLQLDPGLLASRTRTDVAIICKPPPPRPPGPRTKFWYKFWYSVKRLRQCLTFI